MKLNLKQIESLVHGIENALENNQNYIDSGYSLKRGAISYDEFLLWKQHEVTLRLLKQLCKILIDNLAIE